VHRYLTKNGSPVLPQPPYIPDPHPANYYLLPRMKGYRFQTADVKMSMTTALMEDTGQDLQG
jgi:hypothetical protein